MVSAEARSAPLIEDYVRDITPDLYGGFWSRRRIVEELTDHLLETVHRLHKQGTSWAEAQKRAIAQFGSPSLVARTFAQSKGVGVPTTFTRYSGLAGILGSLVLTGAFIGEEFSESFSHGPFAEVATSGAALLGIGMVGMYVRCRGQLGFWGRIGFRLIIIGAVMGFGFSAIWFAPGAFVGLLALLVGVLAYLTAVLRSGVLPKSSLMTILAGVLGTLVFGVIGAVLRFDTGSIGVVIGTFVVTVGLVGVGRFMWSEQAVDRSEWSDPAHPA